MKDEGGKKALKRAEFHQAVRASLRSVSRALLPRLARLSRGEHSLWGGGGGPARTAYTAAALCLCEWLDLSRSHILFCFFAQLTRQNKSSKTQALQEPERRDYGARRSTDDNGSRPCSVGRKLRRRRRRRQFVRICLLHPRAGPLGTGVKPDGIRPHHGLAMLLLLALRSLLPLVFRAFAALFAA